MATSRERGRGRIRLMNKNHLSLWAGLSAFFSTLLSIGAINIINPDDQIRFVGGVFVGIITGATIYARQKMDDARNARAMALAHQGGVINITHKGEKKVFSLELTGDPEDLQHKQEVLFRVNKSDEDS